MANNQSKPRVLVGDATGTWKCKIIDEGISPRDIRLIHRAIDVEFRRYNGSRRRGRRRQQIDDSLRSEIAARKQVKTEAAAKVEEELKAAKTLVEESETNGKPKTVETTKTRKAE